MDHRPARERISEEVALRRCEEKLTISAPMIRSALASCSKASDSHAKSSSSCRERFDASSQSNLKVFTFPSNPSVDE